MPVLLFRSDADRADWWQETINANLPDVEFRNWPEIGVRAEIDYALVWKPETGLLASLTNLRAIFSLGAGVDHIFADAELPSGVPICRVVNPNMAVRMSEWVVMQVLMHHRQHRAYDRQQQRKQWGELRQPHAGERRVGVMGMGELGGDAARKLAEANPALWPAALLQIGCFLGRNSGFTDAGQSVGSWWPSDTAADADACIDRAIDHGQGEYIVACHLLKLSFAIREELRERPAASGHDMAVAALRRFMNSPLKRRHTLRTARQALDFVG